MTEYTLLALVKDTIYISFMLSLPMLAIGTVVGVLVSIFQTATSIQDQSLSFIPKLLATIAGLIAFGPWMLTLIMQFTIKLLGSLEQFAR